MKNRRAFTLLELLVVIAIIAILSALLYTALSKYGQKGQAAASMNNLVQWGSAFKTSLADNDGRMPSDGMSGGQIAINDTTAWFNRLPHYLNEKALSDPDVIAKPPRPGDKSVWINPAVTPEVGGKYVNPPSQFLFCYAMNDYLSTEAEPNQVFARIENLAATVLMSEENDDKSACDPTHIRAVFGGSDIEHGKDNAAHFLFCDGHVALKKRSEWDVAFLQPSATDPGPEDADNLNIHFTFIPYKGATK